MDCLIDPYLVSVPSPDASEAESEKYIRHLIQWTEVIDQRQHRFWISKSTFLAMQEQGQYPNWDNLHRLKSQFDYQDNPIFFDNEIVNLFWQLLIPPLFEEHFEISDIPNNLDKTVIIPDTILYRLKPNVAQALKETLAKTVLGSKSRDDLSNVVFVTVPNGFTETYLRTDINIDSTNENLTEEWEMVFSPDDIDDIEGISTFWENTQRAMEWAKRQTGHVADEIPIYRVGKKFNASIHSLHLENYPVVLRTLFVKTVKCLYGDIPRYKKARYNNKSTPNHPIKKNGNVVTRKDDNATAWRLRIQGQWRLHYWLLPDESIELANVERGHRMHIES